MNRKYLQKIGLGKMLISARKMIPTSLQRIQIYFLVIWLNRLRGNGQHKNINEGRFSKLFSWKMRSVQHSKTSIEHKQK